MRNVNKGKGKGKRNRKKRKKKRANRTVRIHQFITLSIKMAKLAIVFFLSFVCLAQQIEQIHIQRFLEWFEDNGGMVKNF